MATELSVGQKIINGLRQRGIHLTVEPTGLRVHGGSIPAHVARIIQQNRDSVLQALRDQQEASQAEEWTTERILHVYDKLLK